MLRDLSRDDRQIAEWLFLLAFVVYAYFYAGAGWNQNSQFDLTRAIVERHTFAIDAYAGNTGDIARHADHIYTNKSPGLSFLAAVPYAAIHALVSNPADPRIVALNSYLCTIFTVVLFGALVPSIVYAYGRRRGADACWAAAVALAIAFGTELFPYSTLFMLHVTSGALLLVALVDRRPALAGLAAGAATVINYLCAPAVVLFALLRPRRDAVRFAGAAALPLAGLALYQRICFGAFTTLSITREDPRFLAHDKVMGIFGRPSIEALIGVTVSPYRGLFYFAPVLLFAVVGMFWWRERKELAAVALLSIVFFAFNISFNGWEGGFGVGARYLVPLIPLWGLALLHARPRWLVLAAAVVSFAINFTATAVDPQPSGSIPRPLTQYLVPLLIHGEFSREVPITPPWSAATFTGHTSVNRMAHDEPIVFWRHAPGSDVSEWSSFNLGEAFFGPGDARSLIPIALILTAGAAAIFVKARRVPRA